MANFELAVMAMDQPFKKGRLAFINLSDFEESA
jgi:hypothetical protein